MSTPNSHATRRLARLERLLAARQARLAATVARRRLAAARPQPLAQLQRYGYPLALALALAAILPSLLGAAPRRRERPSVRVSSGAWSERLRKLIETVGAQLEGGR